jgi:hypothetical protein
MDNWIDVKKELPKEDGDVIIQYFDDNVYCCYFYKRNNGKSYFFDFEDNQKEDIKDIKYWQPLPKPRK